MNEEKFGNQTVTLDKEQYNFDYYLLKKDMQCPIFGIKIVKTQIGAAAEMFCEDQYHYFTESWEEATQVLKISMKHKVSPCTLLATLHDMGF